MSITITNESKVFAPAIKNTVKFTRIRRAVVAVIGFTVLLIGLAMVVLPGPAVIVIPLGLAILATEFVWAKRLLARTRATIARKDTRRSPANRELSEPEISIRRRDDSTPMKGGKNMTTIDQEPNASRRTFCNGLLLTSAGLALAASDLKGQPRGQHGSLLSCPPVKIEGAERVLPGSFLYFDYPRANDPAVLVRSEDGEYIAYSRKCAHLGCSVDFDNARRCLSCPCHRGVYDARTGYVVYGPPPRPLDQIVLQMRGGQVWAVGRRTGADLNAEQSNPKRRDG